MKTLSLSLAIICLSTLASAADCNHNIPGVTVDTAAQNFDGSCYYTNPKVSVNGTMYPVSIHDGTSQLTGPNGICARFSQSLVSFYDVNVATEAAIINNDGSFLGLKKIGPASDSVFVISDLVCK